MGEVQTEDVRHHGRKTIANEKLAEQAKEKSLSADELEELNAKLNNLAEQVKALDGESRRTEEY